MNFLPWFHRYPGIFQAVQLWREEDCMCSHLPVCEDIGRNKEEKSEGDHCREQCGALAEVTLAFLRALPT